MFLKFQFDSLAWALIIALLSLSNEPNLPDIDFDYLDKAGHFLIYAIFSFFIYGMRIDQKANAPLILAFLIPLFFGILMEYLQGTLSEVRTPEVLDAIANGLGALFTCFCIYIRR
ncbi:MAG: VanZ family protein [Bacteroidota bacterium]